MRGFQIVQMSLMRTAHWRCHPWVRICFRDCSSKNDYHRNRRLFLNSALISPPVFDRLKEDSTKAIAVRSSPAGRSLWNSPFSAVTSGLRRQRTE